MWKTTVNPLRKKKKTYRKNKNCILRTCAGVSQRTRKRMSYGGGGGVDCSVNPQIVRIFPRMRRAENPIKCSEGERGKVCPRPPV
jgi:hypothetical protein